jgi:hypothetical protein
VGWRVDEWQQPVLALRMELRQAEFQGSIHDDGWGAPRHLYHAFNGSARRYFFARGGGLDLEGEFCNSFL